MVSSLGELVFGFKQEEVLHWRLSFNLRYLKRKIELERFPPAFGYFPVIHFFKNSGLPQAEDHTSSRKPHFFRPSVGRSFEQFGFD